MKIKRDEFQRVEERTALELFHDGIRAKETKEKYTRTLKHVFCTILEEFLEGSFEQRVEQFVKLAKNEPEYARDILLTISKKLRQRTDLPKDHAEYLRPTSIDNYFKPIKKLFGMNDVAFSWKRIYSTFPEIENLTEGRGWTRDEIKKMLSFSSGAIDRAIVLIASSSGIRAGAFTDLIWEDITPIYIINNKLTTKITEKEVEISKLVCGMLRIYRGTSEQYPAFITPEAHHALEDYKKEWAHEVGKEPKDEDIIFKKEGDLPRKASTASIKKRVERMAKKAGLRPPLPKGVKRYDAPIMNGFRRFWNKTCKESLSRDSPLASFIKKEFMMGHRGMFKLDRNYFKTQVLELAEEYLQAVQDLTISNEERLRVEKTKWIQERKQNEEKFTNIEKQLEDVKETMQKVHDFASLEYEKDHEKWFQKHLRLCKKYRLDPSKPYKLGFTKPPKEVEEKMKKTFKDWKLEEL